jgi:hypothetical protein
MLGAAAIVLSKGERCELERRVRRRKIAHADAMRAEIVLLAADGLSNWAIAEEIGACRMTGMTWRKRFAFGRLDGFDDEPRCGAPRKIGDDKIAEVVTKTLETMPTHATHWSTRSMAKASGVSVSTVHRIWNAFSLQPHRSETFKLSTDPRLVESSDSTLIRRSVLCKSRQTRPRLSQAKLARKSAPVTVGLLWRLSVAQNAQETFALYQYNRETHHAAP